MDREYPYSQGVVPRVLEVWGVDEKAEHKAWDLGRGDSPEDGQLSRSLVPWMLCPPTSWALTFPSTPIGSSWKHLLLCLDVCSPCAWGSLETLID